MTKNILFIAPEFFNFHRDIKTSFESLGHTVHYIPDRPSKHALIKILIRKAKFLLVPYLNRYFERMAEEIPADSIDEIFILRGEGLTSSSLKKLKQRFPKARVQLYLWDSVARSHGCLDLMPLTDRAWTYDLRDSKRYPQMKFTLNFYVSEQDIQRKRAPIDHFDWDLVFFGTVHGDRLKVISKIGKAVPDLSRFYIFFYFQSPIMYYARKLFDPAFKFFKPEHFSFKPKFGKDWDEVASRASAVLDVHHTQQGGLTTRTLEAMAFGFKLVTTDETIREYPFFNPKQILIIDRNNPVIPPDFLAAPNNFEVHPSVKDLEVRNWVKRFFE